MFGRIKGYRSSGGLQFKADVFRVLLGISSEYGPVACLQPEAVWLPYKARVKRFLPLMQTKSSPSGVYCRLRVAFRRCSLYEVDSMKSPIFCGCLVCPAPETLPMPNRHRSKYVVFMMITTNSCSYGNGCNPSQRTFHLPSFGNPGLFPSDPSHPAHIIATVVSNPPLPGR